MRSRRVGVSVLSVVILTTLTVVGVNRLRTTPRAAALPSATAIQHVVVLMQENRSADHYLGQLCREGQPAMECEPATASNPNPLNPSGPPIAAFHKTSNCEVADLDHSWNGSHREWNNGAMNGFTAANAVAADPSGSRTMGYYDQTDLPFYYGLYGTFATSDRYFQSVLSQTFPNRFYLLAGTSFGHIRNDLPPPDGFTQKTVFELLDAATPPVTWKIYYSQVPFADEFAYVRNHTPGNVVPIDQYYVDAANGALPQVSFIDPVFLASNNVENDEHPPSNIQVGQDFVSRVVHALFTSPNWPSSAMFLNYDEHGGFYDHVPPPAAVLPDAIPPILEAGDTPGAFDRYGFRVPVALISPFAKPQFVSHVVRDHTSVLKFIETRFGLPSLTQRDAQADPMLEMFNFNKQAFLVPPTLPAAVIDPAKASQCAAMEGGRSGT